MKTKSIIAALLLIAVACASSSCSSSRVEKEEPIQKKGAIQNSNAKQAAAIRPKLLDDWYLVAKEPPTFYPRGVSKDTPTSFKHGEWVQARDGGGRWFIPDGGTSKMSSEQLLADVLPWRKEIHRLQWKQKREEKPVGYAGEYAVKTAVIATGAAVVAVGVASAIGGGAPDYEPTFNWLGDIWESVSY